MFPWICPECGRECAPTDMECLFCNPAAAPVAVAAHAVAAAANGSGSFPTPSVAVLDRELAAMFEGNGHVSTQASPSAPAISARSATPAIESRIAEPIVHAAPQPVAPAVAPEVRVFEAPAPVVRVAPELVVHSAPEPVAPVAPEPIAFVAPEPAAPIAPDPVVHAAPEPIVHVAPEPVAHAAHEPVIAPSEPLPPRTVTLAEAVPMHKISVAGIEPSLGAHHWDPKAEMPEPLDPPLVAELPPTTLDIDLPPLDAQTAAPPSVDWHSVETGSEGDSPWPWLRHAESTDPHIPLPDFAPLSTGHNLIFEPLPTEPEAAWTPDENIEAPDHFPGMDELEFEPPQSLFNDMPFAEGEPEPEAVGEAHRSEESALSLSFEAALLAFLPAEEPVHVPSAHIEPPVHEEHVAVAPAPVEAEHHEPAVVLDAGHASMLLEETPAPVQHATEDVPSAPVEAPKFTTIITEAALTHPAFTDAVPAPPVETHVPEQVTEQVHAPAVHEEPVLDQRPVVEAVVAEPVMELPTLARRPLEPAVDFGSVFEFDAPVFEYTPVVEPHGALEIESPVVETAPVSELPAIEAVHEPVVEHAATPEAAVEPVLEHSAAFEIEPPVFEFAPFDEVPEHIPAAASAPVAEVAPQPVIEHIPVAESVTEPMVDHSLALEFEQPVFDSVPVLEPASEALLEPEQFLEIESPVFETAPVAEAAHAVVAETGHALEMEAPVFETAPVADITHEAAVEAVPAPEIELPVVETASVVETTHEAVIETAHVPEIEPPVFETVPVVDITHEAVVAPAHFPEIEPPVFEDAPIAEATHDAVAETAHAPEIELPVVEASHEPLVEAAPVLEFESPVFEAAPVIEAHRDAAVETAPLLEFEPAVVEATHEPAVIAAHVLEFEAPVFDAAPVLETHHDAIVEASPELEIEPPVFEAEPVADAKSEAVGQTAPLLEVESPASNPAPIAEVTPEAVGEASQVEELAPQAVEADQEWVSVTGPAWKLNDPNFETASMLSAKVEAGHSLEIEHPVFANAPLAEAPAAIESTPIVEAVSEPVIGHAEVSEVEMPVFDAEPEPVLAHSGVEAFAEPVAEHAPWIEADHVPTIELAPVAEVVPEPVVEHAPIAEAIPEPVVAAAPALEPEPPVVDAAPITGEFELSPAPEVIPEPIAFIGHEPLAIEPEIVHAAPALIEETSSPAVETLPEPVADIHVPEIEQPAPVEPVVDQHHQHEAIHEVVPEIEAPQLIAAPAEEPAALVTASESVEDSQDDALLFAELAHQLEKTDAITAEHPVATPTAEPDPQAEHSLLSVPVAPEPHPAFDPSTTIEYFSMGFKPEEHVPAPPVSHAIEEPAPVVSESAPVVSEVVTPHVEKPAVVEEALASEALASDLFAQLTAFADQPDQPVAATQEPTAPPPALPYPEVMAQRPATEPAEPKLLDPKQFLHATVVDDHTGPFGSPNSQGTEPPIYTNDRWESPYDLAERLKRQTPTPAPAAPVDPFQDALKQLESTLGAKITKPAPAPAPALDVAADVLPSALLHPEPLKDLPADHWSLQGVETAEPVAPPAMPKQASPLPTPMPLKDAAIAPGTAIPPAAAASSVSDAPSVPAAAPPAEKPVPKKSTPTWQIAVIAVFSLAVFLGAYLWNTTGGTPPAEAPTVTSNYDGGVAAISTKQNHLAKDLEIVGFRMKEAGAEKAQVKFIVINHSAALITELKMNIMLKAPRAKDVARNLSSFAVDVPSIGPFEASEVAATIKIPAELKEFDYPDWSQLRPEFQITSPQ